MIEIARQSILAEIHAERERQDVKFPLPAGFPGPSRLAVLTEEVGEVATATLWLDSDPASAKHRSDLREELVQVAAVAVRWIECLDAPSPTNERIGGGVSS